MQSAIQRASGQLPSDLPSPPTFTKTNPNDQPVIYIALTSDTLTDGELYQLRHHPGAAADQYFARRFAGQHLWRQRARSGSRPIRPRLFARNMTFDELAAAIRAGTSYSGAGQFDGKNTSITLRPNGQLETAEGYRNLIIARGPNNAAGLSARRRAGGRERRERTALASLFRPQFQSAGFGDCPRGFAAGRRQRRRGRALRPRALARDAARIAGLDSPHSDFRSLAIDREFVSTMCRRRSPSPSSSSSSSFSFSSDAPATPSFRWSPSRMSFLITFLAMWALELFDQ